MDEPCCPREQAGGQAGRVLCTVGIRQGRVSLRGVGHLPHDDVAALSLGQPGCCLVHFPGTFLSFIILSIAWRIDSHEEDSHILQQAPPLDCAYLPMRKSM